MANIPTAGGVFLPNYLNNCNNPSSTGQQDQTGTINYPSGLTPNKVIELGFTEAQALQKPAPSIEQLFEGAYQWVQVDSGATAAEVNTGLAAYWKLPTANNSVSPFSTVTGETGATAKQAWAGVFLNPITPGNWGFIFVGAGRCNVTYKGTLGTAGAIGNTVVAGGGSGTFDGGSATAIVALTVGIQTVAAIANGTSPIYCRTLFYRIPS